MTVIGDGHFIAEMPLLRRLSNGRVPAEIQFVAIRAAVQMCEVQPLGVGGHLRRLGSGRRLDGGPVHAAAHYTTATFGICQDFCLASAFGSGGLFRGSKRTVTGFGCLHF